MRAAAWLAAIVLAGASCSQDGTAPAAPLGYDVLFAGALNDSEPNLFRVGIDSGTPVRIGGGIAGRFPAASADGKTIVFNRFDAEGNYQLMILRFGMLAPVAAGGAPGLSALQPVLSPDGTRVAFSSPRDDPYGDIFVATLTGTELTDVRPLTAGGGADLNPRWSPDGQRIAFTAYRTGFPSIWSMTADGLDLRQVTSGASEYGDYSPSWSPDGTTIAFQRIGLAASRIGLVSSAGGEPTFFELTGRNYSPAWSPDGKYIAIASNDDDIRILSSTGALVRRVEWPGVDRSPAWIRSDAQWP